MSVDAPSAEPGRTRRSSRSLTVPETAQSEHPQTTRAQLRGRTTDAAPAGAGTDTLGDAEVVIPVPSSRRARRILATPTVAMTVIDAGAAMTDVAPRGPATPAEQTLTAVDASVIAESAISSTADDAFELLEPVFTITDDDHALSDDAPAAELPRLDEFEAAARLFSFTGETPIISSEPVAQNPVPATRPAAARRGRRMTGASFKRAAAASFSVGVMSIVGLLAVGLTTPTQAVAAATGTPNVESAQAQLAGDAAASGQIQAYVAPAEIQNTQIQRAENYQTARLVDLAGSEGISNFSSSVFTNNPNCPIQWPFAVGVTMSYGFGMRDGNMHEGVDFTPGDGAHIQAIDDGVVRISTDSGGAFGVTVVIDHVVDGQLVSSRYGHMQYGSRQVEVGDHVSVGEYIGRTGDTGRSFGAHTHVEILAGGTTPIDPLPWFQQHATC